MVSNYAFKGKEMHFVGFFLRVFFNERASKTNFLEWKRKLVCGRYLLSLWALWHTFNQASCFAQKTQKAWRTSSNSEETFLFGNYEAVAFAFFALECGSRKRGQVRPQCARRSFKQKICRFTDKGSIQLINAIWSWSNPEQNRDYLAVKKVFLWFYCNVSFTFY